MKRYQSWFMQAESDVRAVEALLAAKQYSHVCFLSQQAAEKCLKALAYKRGCDLDKSHSLVQILADLKINGNLEKMARRLDVYYLSARYPDALPDGLAPVLTFDESQATEAMQFAKEFLSTIRSQIGDL